MVLGVIAKLETQSGCGGSGRGGGVGDSRSVAKKGGAGRRVRVGLVIA